MKRKTLFGIPYEFYWSGKIKMPVKAGNHTYTWYGIYGLQFGNWFFGTIKGKRNEYI